MILVILRAVGDHVCRSTWCLPRTDGAEGEALVAIFGHAELAKQLAFRGGTALDKLHIRPAARYSEDIDLVQLQAIAIGRVAVAHLEPNQQWWSTETEGYRREISIFGDEHTTIGTGPSPDGAVVGNVHAERGSMSAIWENIG